MSRAIYWIQFLEISTSTRNQSIIAAVVLNYTVPGTHVSGGALHCGTLYSSIWCENQMRRLKTGKGSWPVGLFTFCFACCSSVPRYSWRR